MLIHFLFPPAEPSIKGISDLNEDILHLIFENFDLQPGSPTIAQTRKDLLLAAKTCKAFVEPALNSLWRVLPSLLPLLLLLPSAEVRDRCYVSSTPSLYLSRNSAYFIKFVDRLPLNDWERFDVHAPRVRSLYLERLHIVISPHVYLRIRSLRPRDTPLLPGLQQIYIPNDLNTSFDFSPALLLASDSSLNSIHLHNSATSDRQFCIPFLFLLSVNSPNLTHLTLLGTVHMSLELVFCFKNLQSLDLRFSGTFLDSQFLQDLGKLDNLLDLTLDTGPSIDAPTTRSLMKQSDLTLAPTNSTFKQLRKLYILGTPSSIGRVLDGMHVLMNLTTLLIHEKPDDLRRHTESSWKHCFEIISAFPAIKNIHVIQSESSPGYRLSTSCFYPLYQLNNLTSFVIKNGTLSGSDEDFRLLACAFPNLTTFVEPCAEYRGAGPGRTLACLFHFSQANRQLRNLKISLGFDISDNLKAINDIGRPIFQNHPLESLHISSNFGSLNLPDTIQVAQFLDLIFPKLSTLKAYCSDTYEVSNWTKIEQIRVALQAARKPRINFKLKVGHRSDRTHR